MADQESRLRQAVSTAHADGRPLDIRAGGSKRWYGRTPRGEPLHVGGHSGILTYQPTELVLTARAGTPLSDIAAALDEHRQRLAFDPPYFGQTATLGGTIACGLSGPRRPYAGSARDFVLGCKLINGRGQVLRFGGEVMKNVAGFDASRLMAGGLGTLGVLLEVSLKVLPHQLAEHTVCLQAGFSDAIAMMNRWAATPLPVTAMAADGQRVYFRICATPADARISADRIGGQLLDEGLSFWKGLREHQLPFFTDARPLWRLSVPAAAPHPLLPEAPDADWFVGWGGAQRWLKSELPPEEVFQAARNARGHATLFRGGDREGRVFAPMPAPLFALHRRLKAAFDPAGILNPGRIYDGL